MKVRRFSLPLLLTIVLALLAACGGQTPTQPASQPTAAAAAATAAPEPTAAPAAPTAEAETAPAEAATAPAAATSAAAPSPVPTATPAISTVGSGSTKIVWWHISTAQNQRDNWQNLANAFV